MMKRKKSPAPSAGAHIDTLIGAHARFKGELEFEGAVRIDGVFEGDIRASNDGTLIVSESARIEGEVDVPNLLLHGAIQGNVRASKTLTIGPTGRLNGDVEYAAFSLAEGGAVNGRCIRIDEKAQARQHAAQSARPSAATPPKQTPQSA